MKQIPQAVALKYDEITAPKVTAKGGSEVAEEIIRLAEEHGVPLYENADLVDILAQLELGEEIPEILYQVIAEIIAFAYYLQAKFQKGLKAASDKVTTGYFAGILNKVTNIISRHGTIRRQRQ